MKKYKTIWLVVVLLILTGIFIYIYFYSINATDQKQRKYQEFLNSTHTVSYEGFNHDSPPQTDSSSLINLRYGYEKDQKNAWHDGRILENVDLNTFKVIEKQDNIWHGHNFAQDKNHVWYNEKLVRGADPDTFSYVISSNHYGDIHLEYIKDKNHVWYLPLGIKKIEADPETFESISERIFKDKNHIWTFGKKIIEADVNTFVSLYNDRFFKDKNHVWAKRYIEDTHAFDLIMLENVDPVTFTQMSDRGYYSDKDNVWYDGGHKLKDADPNDFQVLENFYQKSAENLYHHNQWLGTNINVDSIKQVSDCCFSEVPPYSEYYLKNTEYVWRVVEDSFFKISVQRVDGADPATFEHFGWSGYTKDKNHVWHEGELLFPGLVDPQSFEKIEGGSIAKDNNNVYVGKRILEIADTATFVRDGDNFKDKHRIYLLDDLRNFYNGANPF